MSQDNRTQLEKDVTAAVSGAVRSGMNEWKAGAAPGQLTGIIISRAVGQVIAVIGERAALSDEAVAVRLRNLQDENKKLEKDKQKRDKAAQVLAARLGLHQQYTAPDPEAVASLLAKLPPLEGDDLATLESLRTLFKIPNPP